MTLTLPLRPRSFQEAGISKVPKLSSTTQTESLAQKESHDAKQVPLEEHPIESESVKSEEAEVTHPAASLHSDAEGKERAMQAKQNQTFKTRNYKKHGPSRHLQADNVTPQRTSPSIFTPSQPQSDLVGDRLDISSSPYAQWNLLPKVVCITLVLVCGDTRSSK